MHTLLKNIAHVNNVYSLTLFHDQMIYNSKVTLKYVPIVCIRVSAPPPTHPLKNTTPSKTPPPSSCQAPLPFNLQTVQVPLPF